MTVFMFNKAVEMVADCLGELKRNAATMLLMH